MDLAPFPVGLSRGRPDGCRGFTGPCPSTPLDANGYVGPGRITGLSAAENPCQRARRAGACVGRPPPSRSRAGSAHRRRAGHRRSSGRAASPARARRPQVGDERRRARRASARGSAAPGAGRRAAAASARATHDGTPTTRARLPTRPMNSSRSARRLSPIRSAQMLYVPFDAPLDRGQRGGAEVVHVAHLHRVAGAEHAAPLRPARTRAKIRSNTPSRPGPSRARVRMLATGKRSERRLSTSRSASALLRP